MTETEFSVNPHSGELVVRGADPALLTTLAAQLGGSVDLDCGECPPPVTGLGATAAPETPGLVRVAGFLHQSMVDGPGLRSVVFFQGCARACPGCRSMHTHSFAGGTLMPIDAVVAELLRPDQPRDGVTISGGEPLVQADACARLIDRLKIAGIHVLVYTGFTYEELVASATRGVARTLALADTLIDGPFDAALRKRDLQYRGSSNQRFVDLAANRAANGVRLLPVD